MENKTRCELCGTYVSTRKMQHGKLAVERASRRLHKVAFHKLTTGVEVEGLTKLFNFYGKKFGHEVHPDFITDKYCRAFYRHLYWDRKGSMWKWYDNILPHDESNRLLDRSITQNSAIHKIAVEVSNSRVGTE